MKDEYSLVVKDLHKSFYYFNKDYKILKWIVTGKGEAKRFDILKGLTFDVKKGQRVGIIGKNGAGKSTLLKLINGIYVPSSGEVEVEGKISSLIELGAGFNPELTGRENIYFKGMLLGFTKKEIDEKMDDIIDFADIGEYMDMPFKTYSSGMGARLGFSLATSVDPDILIVDEVFAVGDKNFAQKSRVRTDELLKTKGRTILIVSHSEALLKEFCDTAIYLKDGHIAFQGDVSQALEMYNYDQFEQHKRPIAEVVQVHNEDDKIIFDIEYGFGVSDQMSKVGMNVPLESLNFRIGTISYNHKFKDYDKTHEIFRYCKFEIEKDGLAKLTVEKSMLEVFSKTSFLISTTDENVNVKWMFVKYKKYDSLSGDIKKSISILKDSAMVLS